MFPQTHPDEHGCVKWMLQSSLPRGRVGTPMVLKPRLGEINELEGVVFWEQRYNTLCGPGGWACPHPPTALLRSQGPERIVMENQTLSVPAWETSEAGLVASTCVQRGPPEQLRLGLERVQLTTRCHA